MARSHYSINSVHMLVHHFSRFFFISYPSWLACSHPTTSEFSAPFANVRNYDKHFETLSVLLQVSAITILTTHELTQPSILFSVKLKYKRRPTHSSVSHMIAFVNNNNASYTSVVVSSSDTTYRLRLIIKLRRAITKGMDGLRKLSSSH